MSMGHQIIVCPVANALVRPGLTAIYIYKYVNMPYCCTETYFEDGFIATYIHSSLYSCVYKYNNSHNSYYFVLDKGFSENEQV